MNSFLKHLTYSKIRGSAIYYSLLFLFLVGSLITVMIFLFNAYTNISRTVKNESLCAISIHEFKDQLSNGLIDLGIYNLESDYDLTGKVKIENFGVFRLFSYQVNYGDFNMTYEGLLKGKEVEFEESLFMGNSSFPLSVSGNTNISGKIKIPERGIKTTFVSSQKRDGRPQINTNKVEKSNDAIPALMKEGYNPIKIEEYEDIRSISSVNGYLHNSFSKPTIILELKNTNLNITDSISGNIIIYSTDSISVSNNVRLNNVIIYAPIIYIEDDSHLKCQVFGSEKVHVGENVTFSYPSAIIVSNASSTDPNPEFLISIQKNTIFNGVIILNHPIQKKCITLAESVNVTGTIYSTGCTELKDDVVIEGQLITNSLYRKTASSEYDNLLLNATIKEGNKLFYSGMINFKKQTQQKWNILIEETYLEKKLADTPFWNQ